MNINFTEPVTNHEFSDDCGVVWTGPEIISSGMTIRSKN